MVLVLALTLVLGATVQGAVGLGLSLVVAPVAALAAPELLPELLLWLALPMAGATLMLEPRGADWRGLAWALPARVVGTAAGVAVVALLTPREIGIAVGVMVLVAVGLTVRTIEIQVNRATLSLAGFVSGATGTATSIGGPPLAVLYQHRPAAVIRPTLAAYFVIGAAMSLVGLGLAGQLRSQVALLALVLAPTIVAGLMIAQPLRSRLPEAAVRAVILAVCAASAAVLLVRSVTG